MLKKEYKIEEKSFDKVNLVLKSHVVEINYDDEIIKLSDGDVAFENDLSEDDQKIFGIDSYISVKRTKLLEQLDNLSMLRSGNFCIILLARPIEKTAPEKGFQPVEYSRV